MLKLSEGGDEGANHPGPQIVEICKRAYADIIIIYYLQFLNYFTSTCFLS